MAGIQCLLNERTKQGLRKEEEGDMGGLSPKPKGAEDSRAGSSQGRDQRGAAQAEGRGDRARAAAASRGALSAGREARGLPPGPSPEGRAKGALGSVLPRGGARGPLIRPWSPTCGGGDGLSWSHQGTHRGRGRSRPGFILISSHLSALSDDHHKRKKLTPLKIHQQPQNKKRGITTSHKLQNVAIEERNETFYQSKAWLLVPLQPATHHDGTEERGDWTLILRILTNAAQTREKQTQRCGRTKEEAQGLSDSASAALARVLPYPSVPCYDKRACRNPSQRLHCKAAPLHTPPDLLGNCNRLVLTLRCRIRPTNCSQDGNEEMIQSQQSGTQGGRQSPPQSCPFPLASPVRVEANGRAPCPWQLLQVSTLGNLLQTFSGLGSQVDPQSQHSDSLGSYVCFLQPQQKVGQGSRPERGK
ncbi:unnamed protein product [Nyctereutes procyonoides]|uniref:(raccoon dog) hypothetical protein n=1 Tax=Nyctereutes procyonoides TaxID=34880 RepID=A0A811ZPD9_NYCPR|nr:unnamed protein product [Nyctereutes procyonoides]